MVFLVPCRIYHPADLNQTVLFVNVGSGIHDDDVTRRVLYRHRAEERGRFQAGTGYPRFHFRAALAVPRCASTSRYIVLLLGIESRSDAKLVDIIIERTHELKVHFWEPLVLSRQYKFWQLTSSLSASTAPQSTRLSSSRG